MRVLETFDKETAMPVRHKTLPLAAALALTAAALAACGHNMEQRTATGAIAGAVVAGPPGAVVGAGVGAVVNEAESPKK